MKKGKKYARARSVSTRAGRPPIAGACAALSDWGGGRGAARPRAVRHAHRRPRGALRRERQDAAACVQEDGREEWGDRMTATERLRAMLDERGVEWEACRVPTLRSELAATFWHDRDGNPCSALEGADDVPDGMLSVQANLTPEQAIEATLGRGECRLIPTRDKPRSKKPTLTCSECGWWTDRINDEWRYCPSCGKRVKA